MPFLFSVVVMVRVCRAPAIISLVLLFPALLLAHGRLVRTEPPINSRVVQRPSEIRLWFSELIEQRFSRITVHRATRDLNTGQLHPHQRVDHGIADGPQVTRELAVKVPTTLPPGLYLLRWKVFSIDAHHATGRFTLTYDPPVEVISQPR